MVALAPNSSETSTWDVLDTFPKLHSRAREAKTRSCTEVPHSKLLVRVEIWLTIYDCRAGLESFTRDPIGFDGGDNFYVYWNSLRDSDPSGLSPFNCTSQKISLNFPSALGKMGSIGDLLAKLQRFSDNEKLKGILPCSLKLNGSLAFEHSSCQSCCDKGGAGDKGHFTLSGSAGVGVSCTSNGGVGLYTTVSGSLDVNVYFERKWDTCVPKDEANACLTLNGSLSWSVCTGLAAIGTRACVKISVDCKGGYCINAHNLTGGWTGGCKVRVSGDACAFFQCVGGSFPPIFEFP